MKKIVSSKKKEVGRGKNGGGSIWVMLGLFWMLLPAGWLFSRETVNYYRVDKVITIAGDVTDIKNEPCFSQEEFTVIYLKETKSGTIYRVEVSPRWFFNMDLMTGHRIEVTGSAFKTDQTPMILARSMVFQGELYQFRDPYGFPLWRGKGKGKGMNRNTMEKGGMRRRGRS